MHDISLLNDPQTDSFLAFNININADSNQQQKKSEENLQTFFIITLNKLLIKIHLYFLDDVVGKNKNHQCEQNDHADFLRHFQKSV
jgi:hypothetical protein